MKAPSIFVSALLALASLASAQEARSPFLPQNAQSTTGGPPEAYELAGASATSKGTEICLYDTVSKHSRWLTVGRSDAGIQVISYDPSSDQAVVKFDGQSHILSLRKAKTGSTYAAPQIVSGPMAPAGSSAAANQPVVDPSTIGKSPETIKQEREARMLVSDLLEISIAQRKAYEEAQKKAAAQKKAGS